MAPTKPTPWLFYGKMTAVFSSISIGGPALVYYVSPTEAELFQKYSPDLQKRSLENRYEKQKNFDDFVGKLKEFSKSDKPIWDAAIEAQRRDKEGQIAEQVNLSEEIEKRKKEMKKHVTGMPGGGL